MRLSRDQWAMQLALLTAQRSTCMRRSVGAVLLDVRGHVLATGYNGVAAGQPHCNEPDVDGFGPVIYPVVYPFACPGATSPSGTNLDGCYAVHAEQNALLQCHDVYQIDTCYVTTSPCITCTKLLLNTACRRIVFLNEYPHADSQFLWESSGRIWQKI